MYGPPQKALFPLSSAIGGMGPAQGFLQSFVLPLPFKCAQ
jgi:hypothetical protein